MVQCFQAVCTHKGVPFRFTLMCVWRTLGLAYRLWTSWHRIRNDECVKYDSNSLSIPSTECNTYRDIDRSFVHTCVEYYILIRVYNYAVTWIWNHIIRLYPFRLVTLPYSACNGIIATGLLASSRWRHQWSALVTSPSDVPYWRHQCRSLWRRPVMQPSDLPQWRALVTHRVTYSGVVLSWHSGWCNRSTYMNVTFWPFEYYPLWW